MILVYIGGIGNIYSYLNCLLLANLCLIHFVAIIKTRKLFSTVFGILKLTLQARRSGRVGRAMARPKFCSYFYAGHSIVTQYVL